MSTVQISFFSVKCDCIAHCSIVNIVMFFLASLCCRTVMDAQFDWIFTNWATLNKQYKYVTLQNNIVDVWCWISLRYYIDKLNDTYLFHMVNYVGAYLFLYIGNRVYYYYGSVYELFLSSVSCNFTMIWEVKQLKE